ncbi:MAG: hypothetical protein LBE17_09305 [Treponema sp.]|nr:hypothetical protein [Treponema sp.]
MDSKTTALHSLYTIFLSQTTSFLLVLVEGSMPPANPFLVITMVTGGISGGMIGSRTAKVIGNEQVDRLFSVVLGLVILLSAYNVVRLAVLA